MFNFLWRLGHMLARGAWLITIPFCWSIIFILSLSVTTISGAVEPNQPSLPQRPFGFTATARLPGPTAAHTATVLPGGDVLVVGGYGKLFGQVPIASSLARIFDHRKQSWRVVAQTLRQGRLSHAALGLPDGKVLIVGGRGQSGQYLRSVEIFDPVTEQFRMVGKMQYSHRNPRLNLLGNGKVLVTGWEKLPEIIELDPNNPARYRIRLINNPTAYRHADHVAINLADGSVLLAGGRTVFLEKFDPATETFTTCRARLSRLLDDQAAALLYDDTILLAGGQEIYSNRSVADTWIYDPAGDVLTAGPILNPTSEGAAQGGASDMIAVDLFATDKKLAGRYILLAGGEYDPGLGREPDVVLDFAQVYDAVRRELINVGPMLYPHDEFAAAALPLYDDQAQVLLSAGFALGDTIQTHCEIFSYQLPVNIER